MTNATQNRDPGTILVDGDQVEIGDVVVIPGTPFVVAEIVDGEARSLGGLYVAPLEIDVLIVERPTQCSLNVGRFPELSQCPNPAARWTPVETLETDGTRRRTLGEVVCTEHDPFHFSRFSVEIGEPFDWDRDERVLRYEPAAVIARAFAAIENLG